MTDPSVKHTAALKRRPTFREHYHMRHAPHLGSTLDESRRITVAFHSAGAETALLDLTKQEEILDELGESDLGRSHDTPACWECAKSTKRSATMLISSGTADRYQ